MARFDSVAIRSGVWPFAAMEITETAIVDVNLPRIVFDFGILCSVPSNADEVVIKRMQTFSSRLNNPAVLCELNRSALENVCVLSRGHSSSVVWL